MSDRTVFFAPHTVTSVDRANPCGALENDGSKKTRPHGHRRDRDVGARIRYEHGRAA